MAATLLAPGTHRLHNIPDVSDVASMAEILTSMGGEVRRVLGGTLEIDIPEVLRPTAPYELVQQIRASVVLLGPLLARCGRVQIAMPGGDDFGQRPIDFHLRALGELGASFTLHHGEVCGVAGLLRGARLVLEYPSHTATDNALMAAVLAQGTTIIENAACEPEVVDLAEMLQKMGARITGAGTSRIEIEGVGQLAPTDHEVIPDRVEAATFLAAVGIAGGEVMLERARACQMDMLLEKLTAMGMQLTPTSEGIVAKRGDRLAAVDVVTLPYPGVATDYKPFVVTVLCLASGVAIVSENLFAGRFRYVDELRRLGADIVTEGHHAVVRGVERLSGAPVRASDLRAGAALVLAGLAAEGETVVTGTEHIGRGYERFAQKLQLIGADVEHLTAEDCDTAEAATGTGAGRSGPPRERDSVREAVL